MFVLQCSCRRMNQNAGDQGSTKRHAPDEINYRDPGRKFKNITDLKFEVQFLCFLNRWNFALQNFFCVQ